ncbi:hypothetical protein BDR03DRAFT_1018871 [Suillus americanus]|nr:hypothetical protein BDR03DRAFT_1018871 [Suillus americanus]
MTVIQTTMPNQNKQTHTHLSMYSPLEEIAPHILRYWKARQTDRKIVENLQNHFDTSRYGLGYTKFRQICNDMGLLRTRQQSHTIESIHEAMIELRKAYPNAGAREMLILTYYLETIQKLGHIPLVTQSDPGTENYRIANAHTMLRQMNDPALQGTLQHRWMQTKKNVKPEITWSQLRRRFTPGFETHVYEDPAFKDAFKSVPNRCSDKALALYMSLKGFHKNLSKTTVESIRSAFKKMWELSDGDTYRGKWHFNEVKQRWEGNPANSADIYDVLSSVKHKASAEGGDRTQCELDRYQDCINNTLKRPDRNKVLPHGVPNLIYESPEAFRALDFKVTVKQDDIDYVRHLYVDPDHPVFDLVPRPLNNFIQGCYKDLGRPPITRQSVWMIYLDLYDSMQHSVQVPAIVRSLTDGTDPDKEPLPLLENQNDLFFHEDTDGTYYMGGIHGGQGLDASDHHRLDELAELDEPGAHLLPTAPIIEEEALVIAEFSDEEDNDETFDW